MNSFAPPERKMSSCAVFAAAAVGCFSGAGAVKVVVAHGGGSHLEEQQHDPWPAVATTSSNDRGGTSMMSSLNAATFLEADEGAAAEGEKKRGRWMPTKDALARLVNPCVPHCDMSWDLHTKLLSRVNKEMGCNANLPFSEKDASQTGTTPQNDPSEHSFKAHDEVTEGLVSMKLQVEREEDIVMAFTLAQEADLVCATTLCSTAPWSLIGGVKTLVNPAKRQPAFRMLLGISEENDNNPPPPPGFAEQINTWKKGVCSACANAFYYTSKRRYRTSQLTSLGLGIQRDWPTVVGKIARPILARLNKSRRGEQLGPLATEIGKLFARHELSTTCAPATLHPVRNMASLGNLRDIVNSVNMQLTDRRRNIVAESGEPTWRELFSDARGPTATADPDEERTCIQKIAAWVNGMGQLEYQQATNAMCSACKTSLEVAQNAKSSMANAQDKAGTGAGGAAPEGDEGAA